MLGAGCTAIIVTLATLELTLIYIYMLPCWITARIARIRVPEDKPGVSWSFFSCLVAFILQSAGMETDPLQLFFAANGLESREDFAFLFENRKERPWRRGVL